MRVSHVPTAFDETLGTTPEARLERERFFTSGRQPPSGAHSADDYRFFRAELLETAELNDVSTVSGS